MENGNNKPKVTGDLVLKSEYDNGVNHYGTQFSGIVNKGTKQEDLEKIYNDGCFHFFTPESLEAYAKKGNQA